MFLDVLLLASVLCQVVSLGPSLLSQRRYGLLSILLLHYTFVDILELYRNSCFLVGRRWLLACVVAFQVGGSAWRSLLVPIQRLSLLLVVIHLLWKPFLHLAHNYLQQQLLAIHPQTPLILKHFQFHHLYYLYLIFYAQFAFCYFTYLNLPTQRYSSLQPSHLFVRHYMMTLLPQALFLNPLLRYLNFVNYSFIQNSDGRQTKLSSLCSAALADLRLVLAPSMVFLRWALNLRLLIALSNPM